MDLTVIVATLVLSVGLGLAGARALLAILLFAMARPEMRFDSHAAMSAESANASAIASSANSSLALSARAA